MERIQELVTVTGKPVTVATGFRAPVTLYPRIVEYVQRQGSTISAETARLWEQFLQQTEVSNDKRS